MCTKIHENEIEACSYDVNPLRQSFFIVLFLVFQPVVLKIPQGFNLTINKYIMRRQYLYKDIWQMKSVEFRVCAVRDGERKGRGSDMNF